MPDKFLDVSRLVSLSDSDITNAVKAIGTGKPGTGTKLHEYSISDVIDMIIDQAQIISTTREANEIYRISNHSG